MSIFLYKIPNPESVIVVLLENVIDALPIALMKGKRSCSRYLI